TRMEKKLKDLKNLDFMSSQSNVGLSNITLSFKLDTDIETALSDVRSKVSDLSNIFPDDMKPPSISKMHSDNWPSFWLRINRDRHDNMQLNRTADAQIRSALERLPAVGGSRIYSGKYYTMQIEPYTAKLFQHRISPFDIEKTIKAQNQDYPAGTIKS